MAEGYALKYGVVIVAAGSGRRMGGGLPKQFRLLEGMPVLGRTINLFAGAVRGADIAVVLPADRIDFWRDFAARFDIAPHKCVAGGEERFHSVRAGLVALSPSVDLVAVHDGVRPLATAEMVRRCFDCAAANGTAVPVVALADSCRRVMPDGGSQPENRSQLRLVQTPQIFRADILRTAYERDYAAEFTDDATLVERAGVRVTLCEGERTNLKLTEPDDFAVAAAIIRRRNAADESDTGASDDI